MNPLFKMIAGHVVRRAANNPMVRRNVASAANKVAKEVQEIRGSADPARSAGQAVQRALNKLKNRDG